MGPAKIFLGLPHCIGEGNYAISLTVAKPGVDGESQNLRGTWPVTIRHRFLGAAWLVVHGEGWGKRICELLSSSSGTGGEERR